MNLSLKLSLSKADEVARFRRVISMADRDVDHHPVYQVFSLYILMMCRVERMKTGRTNPNLGLRDRKTSLLKNQTLDRERECLGFLLEPSDK